MLYYVYGEDIPARRIDKYSVQELWVAGEWVPRNVEDWDTRAFPSTEAEVKQLIALRQKAE